MRCRSSKRGWIFGGVQGCCTAASGTFNVTTRLKTAWKIGWDQLFQRHSRNSCFSGDRTYCWPLRQLLRLSADANWLLRSVNLGENSPLGPRSPAPPGYHGSPRYYRANPEFKFESGAGTPARSSKYRAMAIEAASSTSASIIRLGG